MKHYLASIDLPEELNPEFLALIPDQRRHVNALMAEGLLVQYALAADRSRLWTTVCAPSEERVEEILRAFPIARFMRYTIRELAFHLQPGRNLLQVSLN